MLDLFHHPCDWLLLNLVFIIKQVSPSWPTAHMCVPYFAAVWNGNMCMCSSELPDNQTVLADADCTVKCTPPNESMDCGGPGYAIFYDIIDEILAVSFLCLCPNNLNLSFTETSTTCRYSLLVHFSKHSISYSK